MDGIVDYDLIYCNPDPSWDKEDAVILRAERVYCDIPVKIELENQTRAPIWYRKKFGIEYTKVTQAHWSIENFPCRSTVVTLTNLAAGGNHFYVPLA